MIDRIVSFSVLLVLVLTSCGRDPDARATPQNKVDTSHWPSLAPFLASRMSPMFFGEGFEQLDVAQLVGEWNQLDADTQSLLDQAEAELAEQTSKLQERPGPQAKMPVSGNIEEQMWWYHVPPVLQQIRPLAEKPRWSTEDLALARAVASFLSIQARGPRVAFVEGAEQANRLEVWRIADWFRQQCKEPRLYAAMIFTMDDGPFVGLEWSTQEILESSARVELSNEIALSLAEVPDPQEPWVLQCIKNGELLWSRKISDSPQCTVKSVSFSDSQPTPLDEHGWKVHMLADWSGGMEYMHLYVGQQGEFLFYYLSW